MAPKNTDGNSNAQMAKHLNDVLSDTYMLMIKTHGFHWNVTGQMFPSLHAMFEQQYTELFAAVDEVAERVRALDIYALGSSEAFKNHASVKETGATPPAALTMVKDLIKANEQTRERIMTARAFAEEIEDRGSEDLMIARLQAHDKAIWMLKSTAA